MQRQRWRQTSCWDAPFWVEARRRPRTRVSARMTARSCVLLPRHPGEVTTVVPRRRGNEAISMFHLPKPGRLILKSEHRRKSVQARFRRPDTCRPSGGEAPASRTVVAFRPPLPEAGADSLRARTLIARFARGLAGIFFGRAVTNLSPTNAAIDLGWPWIAVGGLP
jgi:hypothetical protein